MIGDRHLPSKAGKISPLVCYKMLNHLDGIGEFPKGFPQHADSQKYRNATVEALYPMTSKNRKPLKNTAFSVHFVIKGAEKRRSMAFAKAKMLQNELGVTPHLVSVK